MLGALLGLRDGALLGALLGLRDGKLLGLCDGALLGAPLGLRDGELLGAPEGEVVAGAHGTPAGRESQSIFALRARFTIYPSGASSQAAVLPVKSE